MKTHSLTPTFLFWLIGVALCLGCQKVKEQETSPQEKEQSNQYKVIAIKDGDTVELLKDGKPLRVRLQGVDCPEKNQDYGTKARLFTSDLVFGKYVVLVVHDIDRYGRTVGEIILPDGRNLNKELVRNGFAWHYTAYSKDQELARLESEARREKRGLWEMPSPQAPWDFRKRKVGGVKTPTSLPKKASTSSAGILAKGDNVFLCESKSAKTYHAHQECYLFKQCKSKRGSISLAQARLQKRKPCKVCAQ